MSKIKKVFAIILSLAMIMGMPLTTFAAPKEGATITVNNADNAKLTIVQIIKADQKSETGWAFTDVAEEVFTSTFEQSDQVIIQSLIDGSADSEKLSKALHQINGYTSFTNGSSVSEAGLYAIKATEKGYTYNIMTAYVGFGEVKNEEGEIINEYPSLKDTKVDAKKSPLTIGKSVDDEDGYFEFGQILTYTIETYVPYMEPTAENKTFQVSDELYNANYYLTGDKSVAKIELTGEENPIGDYADFVVQTEPSGDDFFTQAFTIDLSELITLDNANAGKKVTITYTVKVIGDTPSDIWNNAASHVGDDNFYAEQVRVHTGNICLTKYNEDKTEQLSGAGFEVRKADGSGSFSEPLKFTQVADGVYAFAPDAEEGTSVIEVFTATADNGRIEKGQLYIFGLDAGTYQFTETTAPKGYSINKNSVTATLDEDSWRNAVGDGTRALASIYIEFAEMTDTKLGALPSTGGMGTTIFTIGGCVIMIAAAGLYFASRRKQENK